MSGRCQRQGDRATVPWLLAWALCVVLVPFEVNVDNADTGNRLLLERKGVFYASEEALAKWRLQRPPAGLGISYRGQTWYPLAAIPGVEATPDPGGQPLDRRVARKALAATRLRGGAAQPPRRAPEPAVSVDDEPMAGSVAAPAGGTDGAARDPRLIPFEVNVDNAHPGNRALLERRGTHFASEQVSAMWWLPRLPGSLGASYGEPGGYPLAAVSGFEATPNQAGKSLDLRFADTRSSGGAVQPPLSTAEPAALVKADLMAGAAAAPTASIGGAGRNQRLVPFEVNVNNAHAGNWVLLEHQGALYAPEEALAEWRLQRPAAVLGIPYRGQTWYPLAAIPGFEATPNPAEQSLDLRFAPTAFAATRLGSDGAERPLLSAVEPAVFVNYDLNYTDTRTQQAPVARELGALLEFGASSRYGVMTSSHVGRNLNSADTTLPPNWVRLETTFTRDVPESQTSLRVGDSALRNPAWGRAVYFGGIQLGRNFSLTPGFITQPIPTLAGMASAPSTLELYVNDALRQTSNVPAGPFVINNFPLLTGAGQARVVVRDVLGRETVIDQPFFYSATLLEADLTDWSVEAGAVRRNLGVASADYGERFAAGRLRRGLSKQLTVEGRAELGSDTKGLGVGLSARLLAQTLGQMALNGSQTGGMGSGREWLLGLEHRSLKHGYTLRLEEASQDFRHIGLAPDTLPYQRQLSASYSYMTDNIGTLGLATARIDTYDRGPLTTYSANYALRVGSRSSLNFIATNVSGSSSGHSLGVMLTIPLDNLVVSSSNLTQHAGQTDAYTGVSRNLSGETGAGWRALAGTRSDKGFAEGGVYYQGSHGMVTGDISESQEQQTVRLGAQGGLVWIDGRLFASRRLQDSFALVEVPGYANVGVGFQGRVLTHTDADGVALLPRLLPYQANSIRLDPAELPISAELDSIEMTAVPAGRSGVKVVFPVRSGRGALIRIVLEDGQPAPAGAELTLVGDGKEFFVARRGEAFVTGLQPRNVLRLQWGERTCDMVIALPPGSPDDIARVGPVICQGVPR